jgi:hypothetical protein
MLSNSAKIYVCSAKPIAKAWLQFEVTSVGNCLYKPPCASQTAELERPRRPKHCRLVLGLLLIGSRQPSLVCRQL